MTRKFYANSIQKKEYGMSILNSETLIEKLVLDDKIYISLTSGDVLTIPYDYTKRLKGATKNQLKNYRLIGGGRGIHFIEIDEDISLVGVIQYKLSHELLAS